MSPSEKRARTLCLFPHFIPIHYCALIAITPCPSLTLWPYPTRLQPIPTQDRYWGQIGGCSSADLCDIRNALLMLHYFLRLLLIVSYRIRLEAVVYLGLGVFLQNQRRASIGMRSSSSPRTRTRSPSRGRGGQSDTEERHRQPRDRQG